MVCGRVSNLLSAYLDRELTGADMLAVRRHLLDCGACRAEHEALGQVRRLIGALPAVEPRAANRECFFQELAAGSRHPVRFAVSRRRAARQPLVGKPALWSRGPVWALWAGAACASLAGGLLLTGLRHPRPPDAVVAMIRPDFDAPGSATEFSPRLILWPGEPMQVAPDWRKSAEPGYQLLGLRQGW